MKSIIVTFAAGFVGVLILNAAIVFSSGTVATRVAYILGAALGAFVGIGAGAVLLH